MVSKNWFFSFFFSFLIAIGLIYVFGFEAVGLTFLFGFFSVAILLHDVVGVFRGQKDLFDPGLFIGLIGMFLFLISPVSQLSWDYWPFLENMNRYPGWVDAWAGLNLFGIMIYKWSSITNFSKTISSASTQMMSPAKSWFFLDKRFRLFASLLLTICFISQLYIYVSFGGVGGFINAFTVRQEVGALSGYDPFAGMGLIMLIAESFKYIFAMYIIYLIREYGMFRSNKGFLLLMLILAIVFIFFGGLRGSRSSTIFPLLFAAGMYHYYVRKLNRTLIIAGMAVMLFFSVSYYWYKIAGLHGIEAIYNAEVRENFNSYRQEANKYMISRDLGRMDFQSLALKNVSTGENSLAFGRTYLVAIFSSIPKSIVPYNPPQITKEKTELLHGEGTYIHNAPRQTTLVLGQFGEAIINFGPIGGLVFYFLLGRWVHGVRRFVTCLHVSDVRRMFLPVASFIPVLMLITDMNVILYQLVRYLALPILILFVCSKMFNLKWSHYHQSTYEK